MKTLHKKRLYKKFIIDNNKNSLSTQRKIYDNYLNKNNIK